MALYTSTITGNGNTIVISGSHRRRDATDLLVTILTSGSHGGGTIAWNLSPDGGTTLIPITTSPGSAVTTTAATSFNVGLGNSSANSQNLSIVAVMSGSTSPSVTVRAYTNE